MQRSRSADFWLQSVPLLFGALFLFGVISALFGPIKYGILPDHLAIAELPAGNALVEGATFIAILAGTVGGGLAARDGGDHAVFAAIVMLMALACWGSARLIPPTGAAAPGLVIDRNLARATFRLLAALKAEPLLWWGALVVSWFWLVGAVTLSLMPPLIKTALGADEMVVTAFLAIFSVGIGVGAALASVIARGRITLAPTLAGAILIGIFALDLAWTTHDLAPGAAVGNVATVFGAMAGLRVAIDCAGLAIAGGLFVVPAFSAVQAWAGADRRARVVAAVNILNAAFITAASIAVALMQKAGATPPMLFALIGVAGLGVAAAIARTMPKTSGPDLRPQQQPQVNVPRPQ